jgi:hypothetical protein
MNWFISITMMLVCNTIDYQQSTTMMEKINNGVEGQQTTATAKDKNEERY